MTGSPPPPPPPPPPPQGPTSPIKIVDIQSGDVPSIDSPPIPLIPLTPGTKPPPPGAPAIIRLDDGRILYYHPPDVAHPNPVGFYDPDPPVTSATQPTPELPPETTPRPPAPPPAPPSPGPPTKVTSGPATLATLAVLATMAILAIQLTSGDRSGKVLTPPASTVALPVTTAITEPVDPIVGSWNFFGGAVQVTGDGTTFTGTIVAETTFLKEPALCTWGLGEVIWIITKSGGAYEGTFLSCDGSSPPIESERHGIWFVEGSGGTPNIRLCPSDYSEGNCYGPFTTIY